MTYYKNPVDTKSRVGYVDYCMTNFPKQQALIQLTNKASRLVYGDPITTENNVRGNDVIIKAKATTPPLTDFITVGSEAYAQDTALSGFIIVNPMDDVPIDPTTVNSKVASPLDETPCLWVPLGSGWVMKMRLKTGADAKKLVAGQPVCYNLADQTICTCKKEGTVLKCDCNGTDHKCITLRLAASGSEKGLYQKESEETPKVVTWAPCDIVSVII